MIRGALQTLNEDACEDLREDQQVMDETEEEQTADGGEQGQYTARRHVASSVHPLQRTLRYTVIPLS